MATTTAPNSRPANSSAAFLAWIGVLSLLVLLGFIGFVRQTVDGHHVTGLNDAMPWGIYITGFVFFVGTSAGATIIGLMVHGFGREDYSPLATRALLIGLLSLAGAVTFVMVDVGSIPRMLRLPWLWRNPTSMFMYTSLTYYVFGALLMAELYYAVKLTRGLASPIDKTVAKWLAIAAVPFALMVLHAPHGGLFAVVKARDFWATPLLPPHFAIAALLTGTALMLVIAVLTSVLGGRELVSKNTVFHLGALLAFFITVAAFMDFFDFIVFTYSDEPAGNAAWEYLTTDHLAFSMLHVGGYVVALALLLFNRGRSIPLLTAAAVIAIIAVAAYRFNMTTAGLAPPLLPFLEDPSYTPTWTELSVTVGIVALVALAYSVLCKIIPLEESSNSEGARLETGT